MTFIGVSFDSEDLTLSVTPERVQELLDLLQLWLQKQSTTLKELQSLVGKLSFVASCVQASRELIARVLNWLRLIHGKKSAQPLYIKIDLLW